MPIAVQLALMATSNVKLRVEVHSIINSENGIGGFGSVQRLEELESSLQFFGSWMFEG